MDYAKGFYFGDFEKSFCQQKRYSGNLLFKIKHNIRLLMDKFIPLM